MVYLQGVAKTNSRTILKQQTDFLQKKSGHSIPLQEPELVIGILKEMLHKNENNSDYER